MMFNGLTLLRLFMLLVFGVLLVRWLWQTYKYLSLASCAYGSYKDYAYGMALSYGAVSFALIVAILAVLIVMLT